MGNNNSLTKKCLNLVARTHVISPLRHPFRVKNLSMTGLDPSYCIGDQKPLLVGSTLHVERIDHIFHQHDRDVQKLLTTDNAGGSSIISEALSFYLVRDLFLFFGYDVALDRTEMEIEYVPGSKITDYSIIVNKSTIIGCSVVRFFNYRDLNHIIDDSEIYRLLSKKLNGINESTMNVINQPWKKQILHIITPNNALRRRISKAITKLKPELISNTVIFITVSSNRSVYYKH